MLTRPPFSAPHHDASKASLLGRRHRPGPARRGQPRPLRGALPRRVPAVPHRRDRGAAPAPRERRGTIARGEESATFPARGMVVLACNPCPCGDYHPDARQNRCTCTEVQRRDYRNRITGPLADRIDIARHVAPFRPHDRRPAGRARDLGRRSGRGSSVARLPAGGPLRRPQLAAERPGAGAAARASEWPLTDAGPAPGRRPALRRPAQPARRHPGPPARLDGRRPRRRRPTRTSTRSTPRCGSGPASRCCWRPCAGGRVTRR